MSRKRDAFNGSPSLYEIAPWGRVLLNRWHEPCLTPAWAANKSLWLTTTTTIIYENVSIRFNRSCSGSVTVEPERSSALGLLSSLLWWLPPRLLAAPPLAWRVLVWWVLAPGLLVSWSSGRCGTILMCLQEAELILEPILPPPGSA